MLAKFKLVAVGLLISCLCGNLSAQQKTTSQYSWNGGEFSYPKGNPEVTSQTLVLDGSKTVPWHCHPVPVFAYINSGILEVQTRPGKSKQFLPGQSLVEVMNTVHRGVVIEAPVELVIFYAGAEGVPNTVLEDSADAGTYCH